MAESASALWKLAGSVGKAWRIYGHAAPGSIQRRHVDLLLELKRELLPYAVQDTAEGEQLKALLVRLAGRQAGRDVRGSEAGNAARDVQGVAAQAPVTPVTAPTRLPSVTPQRPCKSRAQAHSYGSDDAGGPGVRHGGGACQVEPADQVEQQCVEECIQSERKQSGEGDAARAVEEFFLRYPCSSRAVGLLKASDRGVQQAVIGSFEPRVVGRADYGAEVVMCVAKHRRVLTLRASEQPQQHAGGDWITEAPVPEVPRERPEWTAEGVFRGMMGLPPRAVPR